MGAEWTDERCETLRGHIASGMSGGPIARAMGITRSSVMGKASRLNLVVGEGLKNPMSREERLARKRAANRKRRGSKTVHAGPVRQRASDAPNGHQPAVETADIGLDTFPAERQVTLMGLTAKTCHWPLWGDDARDGFYCGGAVDQKHRVYCSAHARIAGAGYTRERGTGFKNLSYGPR